jgi:hypothetical protein
MTNVNLQRVEPVLVQRRQRSIGWSTQEVIFSCCLTTLLVASGPHCE